MDISKLVFRIALVIGVLGSTLVYGVYSGHHRNALHAVIYGAYESFELIYDEMPNLLKQRPIHFLRQARYDGDGVTVNSHASKSDDLLLLSGFFRDHNGVRLVERDGTIVNEWTINIFDTVGDPSFCRNPPATEWNAIPHGTIIEPDGTITVSFESCGMIQLDRCNDTNWAKTDLITHHSPNFTADGGIVIAGGLFETGPSADQSWPFDNDYWEDLIYVFDHDGNLLRSKRLTDLFRENDMLPLLTATGLFSTWITGEFHLNEVEELSPELAAAFPMFEAGDLMLSIRNRNLIMVVDADMEKIKWHRIGPWIRQHDPDFNPDGTITLFDNHTDGTDDGSRQGGSRIWRIDPATGQTSVVYGGTEKTHFYSRERSTHQMQSDDSVLVTEAQGGRVFQVDATGTLSWEWVNRYDEDNVTWMHDASILPKSYFSVNDWSCPG